MLLVSGLNFGGEVALLYTPGTYSPLQFGFFLYEKSQFGWVTLLERGSVVWLYIEPVHWGIISCKTSLPSLELVHLFHRVNLSTWFWNRFICASMLEFVCAIFLGICTCLLCFGVIKLIKMGNISSILKESFLRPILIMLRSEEQWPLNDSQFYSLAFRNPLQRRIRNPLQTLW